MHELRAVVITVSDRCARGEQDDESGSVLVASLREIGATVFAKAVISDDVKPLAKMIREFCDRSDINVLITTGGTGLGPRDNTPEATRSLIQREVPGLSEAMRAAGIASNPHAMLSRGICGVYNQTLIVNLPGSPAAVRESFAVIASVLPHAVRLIAGDTRH